jgi:xylulokinase
MKIGFLGIDLGSTGMRALLADEHGEVLSMAATGIGRAVLHSTDPLISEQDPGVWEEALYHVLGSVLASRGDIEIRAVSVDSTSGTILPVDAGGKPLHNALLYNDIRSRDEAFLVQENMKCGASCTGPSFSLPKILWMKRNRPHLFERTAVFLHAADYLRGLLSGDFRNTDFSNAVKTGYDLHEHRWPGWIETNLGIPLEKLPGVVRTGEVTGEVRSSLLSEAGIRNKVPVVAGATDSTTGLFASGAVQTGDWNTTLGTGLGIRGISERFVPDPERLLYAHRHPEGFWLPGAASNTGGEALKQFFDGRLKDLDREIEGTGPTGGMVYPLVRRSEKFPFKNEHAQGFVDTTLSTQPALFKAFLEGLSYLERMIYRKIESVGYPVGDRVYSMGGGAYSRPWMRIRADVMNRQVCRPRCVETAFGAAVIAGSGVHYDSLSRAIGSMVKLDMVVDPDAETSRRYSELYQRFVETCRERGIVTQGLFMSEPPLDGEAVPPRHKEPGHKETHRVGVPGYSSRSDESRHV